VLRDSRADGSVTKGKRRLNWVWYWNYQEADELAALLTDRTGQKRRTSVPPGMVCAEHWQKQMEIARAFLHRNFVNCWKRPKSHSCNPSSTLPSAMAFGCVALMGEAAFVLRPHTAAAAAKQPQMEWRLAKALLEGNDNLAENLRRFETPQMQMGLRLPRLRHSRGQSITVPHGQQTNK